MKSSKRQIFKRNFIDLFISINIFIFFRVFLMILHVWFDNFLSIPIIYILTLFRDNIFYYFFKLFLFHFYCNFSLFFQLFLSQLLFILILFLHLVLDKLYLFGRIFLFEFILFCWMLHIFYLLPLFLFIIFSLSSLSLSLLQDNSVTFIKFDCFYYTVFFLFHFLNQLDLYGGFFILFFVLWALTMLLSILVDEL